MDKGAVARKVGAILSDVNWAVNTSFKTPHYFLSFSSHIFCPPLSLFSFSWYWLLNDDKRMNREWCIVLHRPILKPCSLKLLRLSLTFFAHYQASYACSPSNLLLTHPYPPNLLFRREWNLLLRLTPFCHESCLLITKWNTDFIFKTQQQAHN